MTRPAALPNDLGEALRQSEERFRLLVEGVREYAIFMLDPDGVVISWNSGAERIKGYTAMEIIGQHYSMFYPTDARDAQKPQHLLATAIEQGVAEDEDWRVRKDGTLFWANVVITPLYDAESRHIGFAKVTRDLTDRRQQEAAARRADQERLAESEERFGSFAQHLPGLVWIKDRDGRYTYVNGAMAAALPGGRDAMLGSTDAELFAPDVAHAIGLTDNRAMLSRIGLQAVESLPFGTTGRHYIVSRFPIADESGQYTRLGAIAIDITERIHAEDALRDADRRKNEFLATLSHELRNPLAPIRNGVHLLRGDTPAVSRDRLYHMLEQQVEHMVRLIDDLLELSRITSGKVDLRRAPTDLRAVIATAIDGSVVMINAKQHRLITRVGNEPVMVEGDPVRLTQVVVNLLNNAAKYTPDGGQIEVVLAREGDDAVIRVRDTGVGIPAEMLPRVFDMFAQVDRTLARASGGLGIGLALARSLVDMHGGSIQARSAGLDLGSEFEVRLAVTVGAWMVPTDQGPLQTGAPALRVLVVDDSHDGADTVCMVLSAMGIEARAAYDGASALGVARGWMPQVVLLDIGMPGMDGYEVARRIRGDAHLAGMRLIALTGWGTQDDRDRTQAGGFDEHWIKPVDPAKLYGLLAARPMPVRSIDPGG